VTDRDRAHALVPDFADDLFAGTAEWYATFRLPYPQVLLDEVVEQAPRGTPSRLVDLACGPGTVCLRIHRHFDSALAVDLEPDMVATGESIGRAANADNIEWQVARAEDVDLESESVDLITIGSAFHRLNRPLVAKKGLRWLRPGGLLAEVGSSTGMTSGDEPWQRVVLEVYREWIARAPNRPPARRPRDPTLATTEQVLRDVGFAEVRKREVDIDHSWTADEIVGYLFSTSYASRTIFGDLADGFADALASALLAHEPSGRFNETLSAYTLVGRTPTAPSAH
jgi:ubiquinone/menaquinone biosynthesis C-methylase UbiE